MSYVCRQRSESEAVARHLASLKAKAAQQEAAKRDLLRRYEEREAAVRELEDGEKRVEERHKESKAQIDEQITSVAGKQGDERTSVWYRLYVSVCVCVFVCVCVCVQDGFGGSAERVDA